MGECCVQITEGSAARAIKRWLYSNVQFVHFADSSKQDSSITIHHGVSLIFNLFDILELWWQIGALNKRNTACLCICTFVYVNPTGHQIKENKFHARSIKMTDVSVTSRKLFGLLKLEWKTYLAPQQVSLPLKVNLIRWHWETGCLRSEVTVCVVHRMPLPANISVRMALLHHHPTFTRAHTPTHSITTRSRPISRNGAHVARVF